MSAVVLVVVKEWRSSRPDDIGFSSKPLKNQSFWLAEGHERGSGEVINLKMVGWLREGGSVQVSSCSPKAMSGGQFVVVSFLGGCNLLHWKTLLRRYLIKRISTLNASLTLTTFGDTVRKLERAF